MEGSARILALPKLCSPPFFPSPFPSLHLSYPRGVLLSSGQESCFGNAVLISPSSDHESYNTTCFGWHTVEKNILLKICILCYYNNSYYIHCLAIHPHILQVTEQIQGAAIGSPKYSFSYGSWDMGVIEVKIMEVI